MLEFLIQACLKTSLCSLILSKNKEDIWLCGSARRKIKNQRDSQNDAWKEIFSDNHQIRNHLVPKSHTNILADF
ncbi:MAG: hypothetical protein HC767_02440 [Akkermansiaceae bacterium]|nr:hypothetical protein [Akkermansiaceae bacterium]